MKKIIPLLLSFFSFAAFADQTACVATTSNGSFRNCITLKTVATSASAADLTGSLPAASLPNPSASTLGGVQSKAAASHQFITQIGTDGAIAQATLCGGSAPSIAAGAGAGTGPTVSITSGSGDHCGQVNVTSGTTPSTASVIATITFAAAFGNTAWCVVTPASAQTALLSGASNVFVGSNTTTFTLNSGAVALTGSTAYKWYYWCGGNS